MLTMFVVGSAALAHAEPLEKIKTSVLDYDENNSSAIILLSWNLDETVAKYKVGCVSCMPNSEGFTTEKSFTMNDVTPLPNSSKAVLYVIAYDSDEEITSAKQILVDIRN